MNVRIRVIFRGGVQGVFFRDYTRRMAIQHSVTGWVRNLDDGTVEAVFEGEETAIRRVVDWLTNEHPYATVTGKTEELRPYTGEFTGFEIRQ